jgi:hypothetical protein
MVWWNTTGKPCRTLTPHSRGPMSSAMTGPPANWGRRAHSVTVMDHSRVFRSSLLRFFTSLRFFASHRFFASRVRFAHRPCGCGDDGRSDEC